MAGGATLLACPPPTEVQPPDDRPFVITDGDGFFGRPFPADGRREDVAEFPNPDETPFVQSVIDTVANDPDPGFSRTSAIWFPTSDRIDIERLPTIAESIQSGAAVQLFALTDAGAEPHPIDVHFDPGSQPFAPANLVTILPVQGIPLRPDTRYAAVLTTDLGLRPTNEPVPAGVPVDAAAVAGITTFTTGTPTTRLDEGLDAALSDGLPEVAPFTLIETYDDFCVFESQVSMPVFQQGDPPFLTGGGAWHPDFELQREAPSRVFVTIPRNAPGPWPIAVMVRTGGGGDRPLIDRGPRAEAGGDAIEAGTGPALHFAEAGVAGVMVDGPLGGLRNPDNADEQFLIFNFTNPPAMRDNLRQSALELALLPALLDDIAPGFDASGCAEGSLDPDRLALFGHSMGATIAPLVVGVQPRYDLLLLSGAGGSWVENILHKQLPLETRPIAEGILGYPSGGLHRHDPFLAMLQWAGEAADPPVYTHRFDGDVFMMQGIVDHYILPPIANSTSLSFGLDRLGPELDAQTPELDVFRTLADLQPFVQTGIVEGPVAGNADGRTRIVSQYPEGPIEDGHEVVFQTDAPRAAYIHVLQTWADGQTEVPAYPGQ